jgi:NAD(P)-dependent dehydrogenase (short-subunit alcohol dehydrogenase family)
VTDASELKQLIDNTANEYGRLDCLINNAGSHPDHRPIDDFSVQEFRGLLRLNLVAYFAGSKFALPHLRKSRGCIINMGSLVGKIGQEWASTYVATKAAISGLTKALAIDEARHGVRINTVMPGNIVSPVVAHRPQKIRDYVAKWQWAGREGTPEEVGNVCLYLASNAASFVNGAEVNVSGGADIGYGIKEFNPFSTAMMETDD